MAGIDVVVTCANRKTLAPPPELRLRSLPSHPGKRLRTWVRNLRHLSAETRSAAELYAGEHWSIVRNLADLVGPNSLWVMSAGYGLVPFTAHLKPYSATFTPGSIDSVLPGAAITERHSIAKEWWRGLAGWNGPVAAVPRSLTALASAKPAGTVMIVASSPYLAAARDDLTSAHAELVDPNRFLIVSSSAHPGRLPNVVPLDARLQLVVNGTRGTLNIRAARLILEELGTRASFSSAHALLSSLLGGLPAPKRYERKVQLDDEVRDFIRNHIQPGTSASQLLRVFRDSGFACEQSRFRRLYLETEEEISVG